MEKDKKKNGGKTLALMIIFGVVFLILGSFLGFYFGTKMADVNNNKPKEKTEEKKEEENKEEEKENSEISQALLKDLEKRAELASWYALDIMYDDVMFNIGLSNVFAENTQDSYREVASFVTYKYYLYKTGTTAEEWSTLDPSYGPCFEQAQNGYCYVVDKAEMLKYDKTMFNIGDELLNTFDGFALLKDDKYYITEIPYGPSAFELSEGETVSSTMNDDKSIDLVVKYSVDEGYEGFKPRVVNYKYSFKLNANNDYYLYSVYEVE